MRKLLCCAASAAALILAASAADAPAPQKKTPAPAPKTQVAHKAPVAPKTSIASKTAPRQASPRPTIARTSAARTTTTARRTTASALPRRPPTTWRNRQMAPTPDRYKEIQGALAAKGYLQPDDASGRWDQTSIDAMKKFQADQKLDSTGKIDSLSLIALGLGPKHDSLAPAPAKPTDPPTPPAESH